MHSEYQLPFESTIARYSQGESCYLDYIDTCHALQNALLRNILLPNALSWADKYCYTPLCSMVWSCATLQSVHGGACWQKFSINLSFCALLASKLFYFRTIWKLVDFMFGLFSDLCVFHWWREEIIAEGHCGKFYWPNSCVQFRYPRVMPVKSQVFSRQ